MYTVNIELSLFVQLYAGLLHPHLPLTQEAFIQPGSDVVIKFIKPGKQKNRRLSGLCWVEMNAQNELSNPLTT